MNRYPDVLQVLTVANIPLETFAPKVQDAAELAKIANEELAELCEYYPDRFIAGVAAIPMQDIDAACKEADRAIRELGLKGVQIYSRIDGEPLDNPRFEPLWELMCRHDLPIWIHPATYDKLDNDIGLFSWPFETSSAMFKLVTGGVIQRHPTIKFIVHHCGAMAPFFQKRIKWVLSLVPNLFPDLKQPEEHFRKFYVDTAVYGNTPSLMCGLDFYGPDHLMFGTDAPLGPKFGMTGETAESIERMDVSDEVKEKIFWKNASDLLLLPH